MMGKDNFLFIVASLAILVSIGGLISSYGSLVDLVHSDITTGYVTNTGFVNVTIQDNVNISLTSDDVNWGAGMVDDGETNAIIDTEGRVDRGNWTALNEGLVIKNMGNVAVELFINSNKNATEFIGGINSSYQYKVTNVEDGACTAPEGFNLGTYYDINSSEIKVCSSFVKNKGVNVDFKLVIPSDSDIGILTSTITATYNKA